MFHSTNPCFLYDSRQAMVRSAKLFCRYYTMTAITKFNNKVWNGLHLGSRWKFGRIKLIPDFWNQTYKHKHLIAHAAPPHTRVHTKYEETCTCLNDVFIGKLCVNSYNSFVQCHAHRNRLCIESIFVC